MSAVEQEPGSPSRRIRREVLDGAAVAAVSLAGSLLVTAVVWLAVSFTG